MVLGAAIFLPKSREYVINSGPIGNILSTLGRKNSANKICISKDIGYISTAMQALGKIGTPADIELELVILLDKNID